MVHGVHGIDELSTLGETVVCELVDGEVITYSLHADTDLGLPLAKTESLAAGDSVEENALLLKAVLDGSDRGPRRDIVLLNAAGVLQVAGVVQDLQAGLLLSAAIVDSGEASRTLARLVEFTNDTHAE
jgi:anthranilate phosphoribosyltransferase